jgi:hypothetical protein
MIARVLVRSAFALGLTSFAATQASAVVLFDNPFDPVAFQTSWCDPCSSGSTGYRVWDSFTLANNSTLEQLRWIGRQSDPLTLGVVVEIANASYGADIFSASFATGSITRTNVNAVSDAKVVTLPDIILSAGAYWLTVHGPSITEQLTWWGQVEAGGDNSLIQYGPDPDNPQFTIPRFQDARFTLSGSVNAVATPLPAALPLFATGLGLVGLLARRKNKKKYVE